MKSLVVGKIQFGYDVSSRGKDHFGLKSVAKGRVQIRLWKSLVGVINLRSLRLRPGVLIFFYSDRTGVPYDPIRCYLLLTCLELGI